MTEDPIDYNGQGVFIKDRNVTISAFVMGAYEVTQELYKEVTDSNPSNHQGEENFPATGETQKYRPVEYVTWYDVIVFCNKLSEKRGLTPCYKINNQTDTTQWGEVPTSQNQIWDLVECDFTANGYRLPTEAEWEVATRGGAPTTLEWKYAYAGVQTTKEIENFYDSYDSSLDDYDWLGIIKTGTEINPVGPVSEYNRVYRGGPYNTDSSALTVSLRNFDKPHFCENNLGFRLVRSY